MDTTPFLLGGAIVLVGLVGTILPGLPGLPLVWLGAVGAFAAAGMGAAGWVVALLVTVQLVVGVAAKYVLASTGSTDQRLPRSTLLLAVAGAAVGFFVIPVVGFLVGAVVAVLLAEHRRLGDWDAARASTGRLAQRVGLGMVVEVGAGLAMAVTFLVAVAWRL